MPERFLTWDCEGDSVAGVLHEPLQQRSDLGVLVLVGGPQYRVGSHRQFVLLGRRLAVAGFPSLRFDFRGMGDSAGEPQSFESVAADVQSAIRSFRAACPSVSDIVVFGLCDAASAALLYVASNPNVRGVVLVNPWVRSAATGAQTVIKHYYAKRVFQRTFWSKLMSGKVQVTVSLRDFLRSILRSRLPFGTRKLDDAQPAFVRRMAEGLEAFNGPTLVILSEKDLTAREFGDLQVRSERWHRLLSRANVHQQTIADADHTFSSSRDAHMMESNLLKWLHTHVMKV